MSDRETLAALIARVEKATGPDRVLDDDIAHAMGWLGDAVMPGRPWVKMSLRYTGSSDAAASLFRVLPEMIPSCPRKATAAALRAMMEDKP